MRCSQLAKAFGANRRTGIFLGYRLGVMCYQEPPDAFFSPAVADVVLVRATDGAVR